MVEYLLKNSRALELIEISHYRLHRQSKSSVLRKLSKCPRRSHACKFGVWKKGEFGFCSVNDC
ncbi:F-box/FBD/LRR-repeat protein isoform X1 [Gossypium australe]|uniref:F-box/FBD/LRR-repeat protein isoform X1 n=1 Tax=Gossypium australe TaxID=47621 RepID=A0A5B6VEK9_9ROSI|nr:F-box/FBD/LRR-repeat protein isoform X1 [Gossypium australe]